MKENDNIWQIGRAGVLSPLLGHLEALTSRGDPEQIGALLRQMQIRTEDIQDYVRFDPLRHTRNLVAVGDWYSAMVLCWRSGQRSTIHEHTGSVCAFKVLAGTCSETLYRFSPCGQVAPQCTREVMAGEVITVDESGPRQVSNLQLPGQVLITLHVYTPPPKSLQSFSLCGNSAASDWIGEEKQWLPDESKGRSLSPRLCLTDAQLEKVVSYMRANMRYDIHLVDFARLTGHSSAHFSVLFKSRTLCSPFQFLKKLRLREAHRLIAAGQHRIARVAEMVGYTNRDHFSEAFRQHWGYSARKLAAGTQHAISGSPVLIGRTPETAEVESQSMMMSER